MLQPPPARRKHGGMCLTVRDKRILDDLWCYRQLMRPEIERLEFAELARRPGSWESRMAPTRLRLLRQHGFLVARPCPLGKPAGRPPLVYSLGRNAAELVAAGAGVPRATALNRVRHDAALSWMGFAHRYAISRVRVALSVACRQHGSALSWETDEELAARDERVQIGGQSWAVRPDGLLRIMGPAAHRTGFVEVQLQSQPKTYQDKALTYNAYDKTGHSRALCGEGFVVLAVTDTEARAGNIIRAVERLGLGAMFWATSLTQVEAEPLGAIWRVAGDANHHALVAG